jgi:transcriptional regulator with XRE-family HTH domain
MLTKEQCKMARVAADLTVRQLGEEIGLNFNTVVKFEKGNDPRHSTVMKLRGYFEQQGFRFPDPLTVRLPEPKPAEPRP